MSPGRAEGVRRRAWRGRSGRRGRCSSSLAWGSYHESAQRAAVAALAGDGVGQRAVVGPRAARRRLDHHHAHVALGAEGEELLGRLAVLGRAHRAG